MSQESQIDHLLSVWESTGKQSPAEKLCADNPELLELFRRRVAELNQVDRLLKSDTCNIVDGDKSTVASDEESVSCRPSSSSPTLVIPGYQLLHELSRGGQGVVYVAVQLSTGRKVAVKVMRDGPLANHSQRERFLREANALATLNNPNIVTVLETGLTADGSHYLTMNYIAGKPLDQYLREYRHTAETTVLRTLLTLFMKICSAVKAAHFHNIVHRDLKPANILVDECGEPHVLDFGLARSSDDPLDADGARAPMTLAGQFLGSLPWASPEQAEGDSRKIDNRTDVYSLGVILYQMLTGGRFPYEVDGNMRDVLNNIITAEPTPPSVAITAKDAQEAQRQRRWAVAHPVVDEKIEAIVLVALAKLRENRYQSAAELTQDIANYLERRPIKAKASSERRSAGRSRTGYWVGIIVVLLVGAGGAATTVFRTQMQAALIRLGIVNPPINSLRPPPLPQPPPPQRPDPRLELAGWYGQWLPAMEGRMRTISELDAAAGRDWRERLKAEQEEYGALVASATATRPTLPEDEYAVILARTEAARNSFCVFDQQSDEAMQTLVEQWRTEQASRTAPIVPGENEHPLNQAWRRHRDMGLKEVETDTGQVLVVRDQLQQLREVLVGLHSRFLQPPAGGLPTGKDSWLAELPRLLENRRKLELQKAIGALGVVGGPLSGNLAKVHEPYQQWADQLANASRDLCEAQKLLDSRGQIDVAEPGGKTARQLFERCAHSPAYPDVARIAVEPVTRLTQLLAISERKDRADLAGQAAANDLPREVLLAIALRLSSLDATDTAAATDWTRLRDALELSGRLARRFADTADITTELRADVDARIGRFVTRGNVAQLVEYAADHSDELQLNGNHLPWLQFDIALWRLKASTLSNEPDAKAALDGLKNIAKRLRTSMDRDIDDMLSRPIDRPAEANPRWTKVSLPGKQHLQMLELAAPIEFVPLPDAKNPVVYISTTEVSLGQFIAIASNRWGDFADLLPKKPAYKPCVWQWEDGVVKPAEAGIPQNLLVPVLTNDVSLLAYPMQNISPEAAIHFARQVGCRLPSYAEWCMAYKHHLDYCTNAKIKPGALSRLRGQAWRDQRVKPLIDQGLVTWLDDGIFMPMPDEVLNVARHADAPANTEALAAPPLPAGFGDDRSVLFRKVDYKFFDGTIKDIVGNVAEYVFDGQTLTKGPPAPAQLKAWMAHNAFRLRVVGGSALSPPEADVTKPYRVDLAKAANGFTDVGFRLVYDAPGVPLSRRLQRLVMEMDYLLPKTVE